MIPFLLRGNANDRVPEGWVSRDSSVTIHQDEIFK